MCGLAKKGWLGMVLLVNLGDVADPARHRRDVERGIASADYDHLAGHRLQPPFVEGAQERDAADAIGSIEAGQRQAEALMGAEPPKNSVEVLLQLRNRDVAPDARLERNVHAHRNDAIDLAVEHRAGRAKARDAEPRHAAERVMVVEHGDRMSAPEQLIGGR